jgi:hypothetical protein
MVENIDGEPLLPILISLGAGAAPDPTVTV